MVDILELRDPYTAGHSHRVAETAQALALRLGLTPEEARMIQTAGAVHDIGKVVIDSAVLSKADALSPEEWQLMRLHPVFGARVVERFASYGDGFLLVRHHHEAWDGSGYPDGLKGEEIPLGARILAVADTFDALTSHRPYRKALTVVAALQILDQGAGTQWDATVVAALQAHVATNAPAAVVTTQTAASVA
jgi:HD-GYP domain-containing protein (c-di-GMP phosphodiesterase class II)